MIPSDSDNIYGVCVPVKVSELVEISCFLISSAPPPPLRYRFWINPRRTSQGHWLYAGAQTHDLCKGHVSSADYRPYHAWSWGKTSRDVPVGAGLSGL